MAGSTSDGKKIVGMYRIRMPRLVVALPGGDNGAGMLTPTDARTIEARDEMVQPLDLNKAMRMSGKERLTAFQELLKKDPESPAVLWVVHQALRLSAREKDVGFDYKDLVNRAVTVAAAGGPALERREAMILAELLANIDGQTDLALEQAHRAEKLLGKNATLAEQAGVLTLLETVLKTAGKEDQLKEVRGRLSQVEAELDKQYLASLPFKPTPSTVHPKNGRVVVLELFNVIAQSPMSAGPEAAFDGLLKTYPSGDVVLLQYHAQGSGGVDPLSSPDGDARWNYYRRLFTDKTRSSFEPTAIFNGKEPKRIGGLVGMSKSHYQGFSEGLSIWFDAEAGPKLKLTATGKEGKIDIQATVNDLGEPGKDKRLRLLLVEESVHYAGANGIRIHNRVVRSMPGGSAGFALKEANSKQTATVDLAELKKQLADSLEETYKKRPTPDREGMAGRPLPIAKRPLDLKNLKLVALVQDDKTGEILQAAEVDLDAGKNEK